MQKRIYGGNSMTMYNDQIVVYMQEKELTLFENYEWARMNQEGDSKELNEKLVYGAFKVWMSHRFTMIDMDIKTMTDIEYKEAYETLVKECII